jgi:hypothetical protein
LLFSLSGSGPIPPNKAPLDAGATVLDTHGAFLERQPPDCFCFVAVPATSGRLPHPVLGDQERKSRRTADGPCFG